MALWSDLTNSGVDRDFLRGSKKSRSPISMIMARYSGFLGDPLEFFGPFQNSTIAKLPDVRAVNRLPGCLACRILVPAGLQKFGPPTSNLVFWNEHIRFASANVDRDPVARAEESQPAADCRLWTGIEYRWRRGSP